MSSYGLIHYLREQNSPEHPFWEKNASYTLKDLETNSLFRNESSVINELLVKWIKNDSFILNLGSGNSKQLLKLLMELKGKYFLLNVDISSIIIRKTNIFCEETGFSRTGSIYTLNELKVENIRADMMQLLQMPRKARIKNEIKKDYRHILILAHNSLHNIVTHGDEGLNSILKMISFFNFSDSFFATFIDIMGLKERIAYYRRNIKEINRIQEREVSNRNSTIEYGKKTEVMVTDFDQDSIDNSSSFLKQKAVILDFLTEDCQHTGFRTVLFSKKFMDRIFESCLPFYDINTCGYEEKRPQSPVLLPVIGKKSASSDTSK